MSLRLTIARRLRAARLTARVSQQRAADRLDVPRSAISDLESGKRALRVEELCQLATCYGTTPAQLLRPPRTPDDAPRPAHIPADGLRPAERALVRCYRRLSVTDQATVAHLARYLGRPPKE